MRKSMNIKKILVVAFLTVAMCFTAVVGVINANVVRADANGGQGSSAQAVYSLANDVTFTPWTGASDSVKPAEPIAECLDGSSRCAYVFSFGGGNKNGDKAATGGIWSFPSIPVSNITSSTVLFKGSNFGVSNYNGSYTSEYGGVYDNLVIRLTDGTNCFNIIYSNNVGYNNVSGYSDDVWAKTNIKQISDSSSSLDYSEKTGIKNNRAIVITYNKSNHHVYAQRSFLSGDTLGSPFELDAIDVEFTGDVHVEVLFRGLTDDTSTNASAYRQNYSAKFAVAKVSGIDLTATNSMFKDNTVTRQDIIGNLVYTPSIENGEAGDAVYYSPNKEGLVLSMGKSNGTGESTGGSYTFKNIPTDYVKLNKESGDNTLASQGVPLISFEYIGAYEYQGGIVDFAPDDFTVTLTDDTGNKVAVTYKSEYLYTTVNGQDAGSVKLGNALFGRWYGQPYGETTETDTIDGHEDCNRRYVNVFYDKETNNIWFGRGYVTNNSSPKLRGTGSNFVNVYQNGVDKVMFNGPVSITISTTGVVYDSIAQSLEDKNASFKFLVQAVGGYTLSEESKVYPVYNVSETDEVYYEVSTSGANVNLKDYVPLYAFNKQLKDLNGLQATVNGNTYLLSNTSNVTLPDGEYDIEYSINGGETFAVKSRLDVIGIAKFTNEMLISESTYKNSAAVAGNEPYYSNGFKLNGVNTAGIVYTFGVGNKNGGTSASSGEWTVGTGIPVSTLSDGRALIKFYYAGIGYNINATSEELATGVGQASKALNDMLFVIKDDAGHGIGLYSKGSTLYSTLNSDNFLQNNSSYENNVSKTIDLSQSNSLMSFAYNPETKDIIFSYNGASCSVYPSGATRVEFTGNIYVTLSFSMLSNLSSPLRQEVYAAHKSAIFVVTEYAGYDLSKENINVLLDDVTATASDVEVYQDELDTYDFTSNVKFFAPIVGEIDSEGVFMDLTAELYKNDVLVNSYSVAKGNGLSISGLEVGEYTLKYLRSGGQLLTSQNVVIRGARVSHNVSDIQYSLSNYGSTLQYEENVSIGTSGQTVSGLTLKTPAISSTSNGGGYATIYNAALNGEDTVLFKGVFAPQYLKTNGSYQKEFNSFHIRMYDSASNNNFVTLQFYGDSASIGLNTDEVSKKVNSVYYYTTKNLSSSLNVNSTTPIIVTHSASERQFSLTYNNSTISFSYDEIFDANKENTFNGFTENINLQFGFNGIPVAIRGYYVKVKDYENYYKGNPGAVVKDTAVNNGTKIVVTELGGYDMTTGTFNYSTDLLSTDLTAVDFIGEVDEEVDLLNNLGYTSQFGAVLNTVDSGNVIIKDAYDDEFGVVSINDSKALYTFAHTGEYTYYIEGNDSVKTTVSVKYSGELSSDGLFEVVGSGASAEKGTAILYNQDHSDYGANGYSGEVSKLDTRTTSGIVLKGGAGSTFTFTNKINLKDSFAKGLGDYESVDKTIDSYNSFIGLEVAPNPVFELINYQGKDYNELTYGLNSITITLTDAYNSARKVEIIMTPSTVHEDLPGSGTNGYIGISAEDEFGKIPQGVERIGEKKIYNATVFSVGMTGSNPRPFELTYENGVIATPNGSKSSFVGCRIRDLKHDYTGWGVSGYNTANLNKTFAGFTADEVYVTITFGTLNTGHESTQIVLTKLGDLDFTKSTYAVDERVIVDENKADNVDGDLKLSDNLTVYNTFTGNVKPCNDEYSLKGVTAKVWFNSSVETESVEVETNTTYTFNEDGKYKIEYFKNGDSIGSVNYRKITIDEESFYSSAKYAKDLGYSSNSERLVIGFGIDNASYEGDKFIFLDGTLPEVDNLNLTVCYLQVSRETYINLITNSKSGKDNFAGLAFTTSMNKYDIEMLGKYDVECDNRMGTISGYSRSVNDSEHEEFIPLGANVSYAETLENCVLKNLTNGDDISFICVLPCESAYRYEYKYVFQFISGIKFKCGDIESLVPFFDEPITACLEELANEKLGTAENLGEVFSTEQANGYTTEVEINGATYYTNLTATGMEILLDFAGYEDFDAFIGGTKIQGVSYDVNGLDDSTINFYGRNYEESNGDVVFSYGASGFEVKFYGTELKATMYGICNGDYKPYMQVLVDGEEVPTDDANAKKFQLTSTASEVTLVSGLTEREHTVKVLKRSAYARGTTIMDQAVLCSISTDGDLLAPPEKAELKIQIYGDSISCGFGNLTNGGSMTSENTNALLTYAYQTAQDLNAQISIQAHSGWGVRYGTEKTPYYWYDKYDLLRYGDNTKYDFEYQPDIIVINLGTNDASAVDLTEFTTEFTEKYITMINGLKAKCPNAEILLVYGMMGVNSTVSSAIESVANTCNVNYYFFTNHAASGHPIASEHRDCADELTAKINEILEIA